MNGKDLLKLGLTLGILVPGVPGQDTVSLRGEQFKRERTAASEAFQKQEMQRYRTALTLMHRDFPNSSRVLRNLATVEAESGDATSAAELLSQYAAMGTTLNLSAPAFAALKDSTSLTTQLHKNAAAVTRSTAVFYAPERDLLIEDLAYDPATKSFILSSVHRRKILSCDRRGRCRDAIRSTADVVLDAVLAIHVDRLHGVLWATTASMDAETEYQPRDEGRSSILKFRLPSYRLIKRYEPDDGQKHAMGDMTVASNGDAYISDGDSGDVFVVSHQRDLLEPLVPKGTFVSPQTPALSPDETLLYVADYSTGIAAIRLADGHVDWMKSTVPAAFEGIDGLYCAGGRLIAVQNGTMPERIVSFHLKNAYEVNGFEVLDANWQGLGDPTHGVIVGREFFFIANSGWDRVDKDGNFKPGEPAEVRKISLH